MTKSHRSHQNIIILVLSQLVLASSFLPTYRVTHRVLQFFLFCVLAFSLWPTANSSECTLVQEPLHANGFLFSMYWNVIRTELCAVDVWCSADRGIYLNFVLVRNIFVWINACSLLNPLFCAPWYIFSSERRDMSLVQDDWEILFQSE